ncbi:MAG TPA: histidine phosphatase family protein [Ruminiclostridium sp.]
MKTRLIFVRHAEAEGNLNRLFHGWYDSKITEKGHKQAKKVAERLACVPIDIIYSSSLTRTLQTAQYIADEKNLPIIRTDEMKEINGGDWEDKTWDELPILFPQENYTWEHEPHIHQMPNGENMVEFNERLIKEVKNIIYNNLGENICIVTHGTAIRAMLCRFYGETLEHMKNIYWHDNTSVTIVDYDNEKDEFEVLMEGDAEHLEFELSTIQNQEWWQSYMKEKKKQNKVDLV